MEKGLQQERATGANDARDAFLGCPFDRVTFEGAMERIVAWCHGPLEPRTVLTMNAALLVMMRSDPDLARACRAGDLIVADGVPVVWGARLAGADLPARVAGVALMEALLERAAREKLRVFFLGAKEEVVSTLVKLCETRYPGFCVAGYRNGYFSEADHPAIIQQLRESKAHLLFIGMPSPFKETWGERHRAALGVHVIIGVGGSFDVVTGFIKRAPNFIQRVGLEWAWRLMMEPRKLWKRYLTGNVSFIVLGVGEVARRRLGGTINSAK